MFSKTETEREAALTQVNGKLYTVARAQADKSCPLIANAPPVKAGSAVPIGIETLGTQGGA
jgi:hypothetical protein